MPWQRTVLATVPEGAFAGSFEPAHPNSAATVPTSRVFTSRGPAFDANDSALGFMMCSFRGCAEQVPLLGVRRATRGRPSGFIGRSALGHRAVGTSRPESERQRRERIERRRRIDLTDAEGA